ncbi:hypothetical protein JAAARDRAFT_273282 [Jaapia argillacea MUCL 33604]|uniref:Uncharacterized protein n=1 Tax=Jaapia argillacea MUCL 33604 TaxID=933084 RepID=A0A067Q549_9AGAM|nr:hypothetical protein JAAARDRAFT_273282 [Jaapia argillacea MUCL 33604]
MNCVIFVSLAAYVLYMFRVVIPVRAQFNRGLTPSSALVHYSCEDSTSEASYLRFRSILSLSHILYEPRPTIHDSPTPLCLHPTRTDTKPLLSTIPSGQRPENGKIILFFKFTLLFVEAGVLPLILFFSIRWGARLSNTKNLAIITSIISTYSGYKLAMRMYRLWISDGHYQWRPIGHLQDVGCRCLYNHDPSRREGLLRSPNRRFIIEPDVVAVEPVNGWKYNDKWFPSHTLGGRGSSGESSDPADEESSRR